MRKALQTYLSSTFRPFDRTWQRVEQAVTALALAASFAGGFREPWLWVVLAGLLAALFGASGIKAQLRLDALTKERNTPKIGFSEETYIGTPTKWVRSEDRFDFMTGERQPARTEMLADESVHFARVAVVNVSEVPVTNAVVTVNAYHKDDLIQPIWSTERGVWADNTQPIAVGEFSSRDQIRRRDLLPNGEENIINVALLRDDHLYGIDLLWMSDVSDDVREKQRLPGEYVWFEVSVNGDNTPAVTAWFELRTFGNGVPPPPGFPFLFSKLPTPVAKLRSE